IGVDGTRAGLTCPSQAALVPPSDRLGSPKPAVAATFKPRARNSAMSDDRIAATRAEVTSWFFEDYLPRWVAVASGTSSEGPEFIHEYWGTPMHVTGLEQSFWCLDDASVAGFLEFNYAALREAGYSHTVVPDQRVFVYSV